MFASGAAALLFETLWFRQCGFVVGNSVWASSLTLAAFMAGLALGNALIARYGERVRHPVRFYGQLELAIGAVGITLVWVLPFLASALAPVWGPLLEQPLLLNTGRLLTSFVLLLIPSTAMGATLPLLVKALLSRDPHYGSVLGRLYGWNTIGAVLGAVSGELFLIEWLGVQATAGVAAGANVLAAAAAFGIFWKTRSSPIESEAPARRGPLRLPSAAWMQLAAVFLSGAIILAAEVVWFRFLELFVWNSGSSFALMLAVVLAGIGVGGRLAGFWLGVRPDAERFAGPVALLAGAVAVLGYRSFSVALSWVMGDQASELVVGTGSIVAVSVVLMFPVSLLSGVLFTLVGSALQRHVPSETTSTGLLTLSNTLGGAIGALAGGFVFLPLFGVEAALFLLAATYGLVGLLLILPERGARRIPARLGWVAPLAVALLVFPFGTMRGEHLRRVGEALGIVGEGSVAVARETRTETLLLLRRLFFGETLSFLLATGGFGMASTDEWSRRYMKQFVYLPLNLHPGAERALLISYGSGSTAKALRDVAQLREIDVVDISRGILSVSDVVYPDPSENPLKDERVRTWVEDGRFFLQATNRRYDLITSEPPPPKHAGVVSLYTQEFFQLVRDRLTEGGINTHWLPTHSLTYDDSRAIVRAYCEVFPDCTLWKGIAFNWMLMGSRGAGWTTSERDFLARWERLRAARESRALGVEVPEQLGAMFLDDAVTLASRTSVVEPLRDGFPKRLVDDPPSPEDRAALREWMDPSGARARFGESEFIAEAWPEELRARSDAYFRYDAMVDRILWQEYGSPPTAAGVIEELDGLLAETSLEMLPAWLLGAHGDYLAAIDRNPALQEMQISLQMRGRRALAERRFAEASALFGVLGSSSPESVFFAAYSAAMRGDPAEARRLAAEHRGTHPELPWPWLTDRFGLATVPRP
jgi:spermidine synthase